MNRRLGRPLVRRLLHGRRGPATRGQARRFHPTISARVGRVPAQHAQAFLAVPLGTAACQVLSNAMLQHADLAGAALTIELAADAAVRDAASRQATLLRSLARCGLDLVHEHPLPLADIAPLRRSTLGQADLRAPGQRVPDGPSTRIQKGVIGGCPSTPDDNQQAAQDPGPDRGGKRPCPPRPLLHGESAPQLYNH